MANQDQTQMDAQTISNTLWNYSPWDLPSDYEMVGPTL